MAITMLTPTPLSATTDAPPAPVGRWRRSAMQSVRQNLAPWLAVKGVLTALVFAGQVTVWTAFILDTVVSVIAVAYGWRLARRQAAPAASRR